ncbi:MULTISPECIES: hypothetical protein [Amycolatopsis]|uniref:hypothetical protein n=1 Tax=Amycolatopsis TaxID=1813 RepID=UPI000831E32A|nr:MULTISPECIES: hypothetical protein [Amycolatopsis]
MESPGCRPKRRACSCEWAAPDDAPSVLFNDFDGARLVTEHLLGHRYEDIPYAAGEVLASVARRNAGGA